MFEEECSHCGEAFESTGAQAAYQKVARMPRTTKRRLHEIDAHDDHSAA